VGLQFVDGSSSSRLIFVDPPETIREVILWVEAAEFGRLSQGHGVGNNLAACIRSGLMMQFHFLTRVIRIEAGGGSNGAQAPFPLA
jgi:hypothetical protein